MKLIINFQEFFSTLSSVTILILVQKSINTFVITWNQKQKELSNFSLWQKTFTIVM